MGAQQGLRAAGPGLCADQLEQSAVEGRLRMLSLNAMAAERGTAGRATSGWGGEEWGERVKLQERWPSAMD